MFIIKKGILELSEQTVKELMSAIEQAKKEITFTDAPMPDGDMSNSDRERYNKERGRIIVSADESLDFLITLETSPNSQESLGYKLK